jgi:fructokinase
MTAAAKIRIGVDLGGTKIEAIALARDGNIAFRHRVPTPPDPYENTVAAITQLVREVETATGTSVAHGTASVGVGIPGTISPQTGLIKNANSVRLIGHPLDKDLGAALGGPVRLSNDADCFALSEASDGAGAGARSVWGIILGTGCGSGLVRDGSVIQGPNSIAGEWGHNPLPWPRDEERPGPKCYCGKSGCTEQFLSGPGLSADDGRDMSATDIADAALKGDRTAQATMARWLDRLARATATVINIFDPDVIVVGGGLSKISQIYAEVPKLWPLYVFSDTVVTRIVPPKHGDSSGVRGAAWLWA